MVKYLPVLLDVLRGLVGLLKEINVDDREVRYEIVIRKLED